MGQSGGLDLNACEMNIHQSMPRIVKTYNEGRDSIIEVSVFALTDKFAKERARSYVLIRMPLKAGDIKDIDSMLFNEPNRIPGKEYRVMVRLNSSNKIGDLLDI